ncbi:MAG: RidA family protein [Gemmatimonas sp.]|nr:RidA family protein [Gemmatimonas sp.]
MNRKLWVGLAMATLMAAPAIAQESDGLRFIGGDSPNAFLSPMVIAGNTVYLSGALGTDAGPEIEDQTQAVMESIRDSLAEIGATMDNVVTCTVFMADLSERPRLNEVYRSFFPNTKPARSAVGVDLDGPKVEIECIAVLPDA